VEVTAAAAISAIVSASSRAPLAVVLMPRS
jgi:hypothetical protein